MAGPATTPRSAPIGSARASHIASKPGWCPPARPPSGRPPRRSPRAAALPPRTGDRSGTPAPAGGRPRGTRAGIRRGRCRPLAGRPRRIRRRPCRRPELPRLVDQRRDDGVVEGHAERRRLEQRQRAGRPRSAGGGEHPPSPRRSGRPGGRPRPSAPRRRRRRPGSPRRRPTGRTRSRGGPGRRGGSPRRRRRDLLGPLLGGDGQRAVHEHDPFLPRPTPRRADRPSGRPVVRPCCAHPVSPPWIGRSLRH